MNTLYINLFGFIVCTALIVYSGTRLAVYGEKIGDLTGWGKAWVGLILMAAITSLPELITGISSVAFIDAPNLAAGDIFGSCMFNLLILSLIDAKIKKPLTSLLKISHLFTGLFSIVLIAICGFAIVVSDMIPNLLWISPFSILLIIVYLFAIRGIFIYEKEHESEEQIKLNIEEQDSSELMIVIKAYIGNALLVIVSSLFLPYFGESLAGQTGVSNTFFGTLFLAASTSLPELVVSFAAIRMGSFDLAVGNLLGSNIFNIFILAIDDLFYNKGSIFVNINKDHLESIIILIIMTAVVGLGLMVRPTKKLWRLSFDTFIILLLYIGLMTFLFIRT